MRATPSLHRFSPFLAQISVTDGMDTPSVANAMISNGNGSLEVYRTELKLPSPASTRPQTGLAL